MADLSWRDAIQKALEGEQDPIHYTDVALQIVDQQLRTEVGATPANTVGAHLSMSLKDEGDQSPFERVSRGYYRFRHAPGVRPSVTEASAAEGDAAQAEAGLVHAFGMFWRRELAVWNPVRLFGQQLTGSKPVDFADQRGVYLLHDRREVVYVGRAIDQGIGARLRAHTTDRLNGGYDRNLWMSS